MTRIQSDTPTTVEEYNAAVDALEAAVAALDAAYCQHAEAVRVEHEVHIRARRDVTARPFAVSDHGREHTRARLARLAAEDDVRLADHRARALEEQVDRLLARLPMPEVPDAE